jgi:tetratricopeptide (TPR) repeat protein
LPSADRLRDAVPQAGHLVHMPSHIYMRVGQYHDASIANEKSIKADQRYIRACRAQGFYPGAYYPHNVHFLWYAKLFEGRSKDAIKAAEKAAQIAFDSYCGPSPAVEAPRFRHLPWLTRARFGQWEEVLAVKQPPATNDFLIDRVMWHFARGLAFAAQQHPDTAQAEHDAMAKLIRSDEAEALNNPQFPATSILEVANHYLAGKIAGVRGEQDAMISSLEKAVKAEDAIPYMEPAFWPFPTRPALGAALLQTGKAEQAERVFREDLERLPRNGWGLLGLAESLRAQGRNQSADQVNIEFEKAWARADTTLELASF